MRHQMKNITKIDKTLLARVQEAKKNGKYIQTARLILLPLDVSDAPEAFKWLSDPEVTKFMNYTIYTNVDDVAMWIARSGHNCFGFFLRENGQLIGSGDLHTNRNGFDSDVYELGYNFAKAYWGKGYCTEASKAMLAYRVAQGVAEFGCEHAVDNVRSGRVIQKCGFTNRTESSYTSFDGTRTFKSYRYALHIDSHEMNVDGKWFDKIVRGDKTVELRLNDGKRREIKVGDYVILNNLDENANLTKCAVQVSALHKFDSFDTLYKKLDMTKCGYAANDKPNHEDMLRYYSLDRQLQWGVVGIEFEYLCAM